MQQPFLTAGQSLEAAGAAVMQRASLPTIGRHLVEAATALSTLATLLPILHESAALAGQRLEFCATQMTVAGNELQGVTPAKPTGKSWLKGGR